MPAVLDQDNRTWQPDLVKCASVSRNKSTGAKGSSTVHFFGEFCFFYPVIGFSALTREQTLLEGESEVIVVEALKPPPGVANEFVSFQIDNTANVGTFYGHC